MVKLSICYEYKDGPWGGSNQFLKALRKELRAQGHYCDDIDDAEALIFGGHPFATQYNLHDLLALKNKYPAKIIIYRIDGPISFYRGRDKEFDQSIAFICRAFVDGIVFQSRWSFEQNKRFFKTVAPYETIISNAVDCEMFYASDKTSNYNHEHPKIIATSWSSNLKKGFEIYEYIDQALDFSKFEMTFVGNSPIRFKNIKMKEPVPQPELANLLRNNDIYITASEKDPCSNSLLEAIACGLPVIALNSGGHPELIGAGGELFNGCGDVIAAIEKVATNYDSYRLNLPVYSISSVARQYYDFVDTIYDDMRRGLFIPKKLTLSSRIYFSRMHGTILKWKVKKKISEFMTNYTGKVSIR
ncbi:MAG: hypothetical protein A2511_09410 [Deltaproteobacteria bacterium RIFOXYD12_FULL_50_9]|nr:MAG: hypothetical protein A2511_09410 [Deltaproteobacteria bacterium RIFOXYD12_FULL_50_9]